MTSPKPMKIEELLEFAALDAFGLLDDYEAEFYTRSFHHAPAGVQDEILRIQAELVADTTLLPTDLPPNDLRAKVLSAVARAIEEDAHELAPLASIGQRFAINQTIPQNHARLTMSGQFWRAVALVMIGVSIVLAYFGAEARQYTKDISRLALKNNTAAQLEKYIGPTFREYVDNPNSKPLFFRNRAANVDMIASLYINEQNASAFLFVIGIPINSENPEHVPDTYTLRAVLADGTREELDHFDSSSSITGFHLDGLTTAVVAALRWEITDATGTVILSTA